MHWVDGLLVVSIHEDVMNQSWYEVEQKEGGYVVPKLVAPGIDAFYNNISFKVLSSVNTRRTLFSQLFGVGYHCIWPGMSALTILNHERSLVISDGNCRVLTKNDLCHPRPSIARVMHSVTSSSCS